MINSPKISVVMSAYNAAVYIRKAVDSILRQTFGDFEFIIVDNGSVDDTGLILDEYQKLDGRVRVYYHDQEGWAPAQNWACQLARGKYVAMMDADDMSDPRRLEKQLAYIESHPNIGVLGTWIQKIDYAGSVTGVWCPPVSPMMLKWTSFFGVCVAHSSVMMRRELLERLDFYRVDLRYATDADLWLRASAITEFANLPEVLHQYRVWPASTTQSHLPVVREIQVRLLVSFIRDFLQSDPSLEAVAGLRQLRVGPAIESLKQITLTATLIQELYRQFLKQNMTSPEERSEITYDAAKKLGALGLQASLFNTADFVPLFVQALKLDCRLLRPAAIIRGLARRGALSVSH
jgi:GT2 family glycosyltransferase